MPNHTTTLTPNSVNVTHDNNNIQENTSSVQNPATNGIGSIDDQDLKTNAPTRAINDNLLDASTDSQQAIGILPYAMGGAVGGTMVLVTITLVAVIVTFLVRKRKQAESHKVKATCEPLVYNNAVYGEGTGKPGSKHM